MGRSFPSILALVTLLAACGRNDPPLAHADGVLQLELGGAHGSLRQTLVQAEVPVAEPRRLVPEALGSAEGVVEPPPADPGVVAPPETPPGGASPEAPPPAPVADEWIVVTLGAKQTLIHLAKKHLGDGNRYRELMQWNGWNEDDVRRLPAGQQVKILRSASAPR